MAKSLESEQLEEGEIVDDDFEDISDNSIIESAVGKFASSNENLRALSLSSDSETNLYHTIKHKKKLLRRTKHQRKRKKRRPSSDTSDSDKDISATCQDLKGKLKEAIHISGIGENRNPLETRLKAMGELAPETLTSAPPPQTDDPDKVDDNELENLRIEALRTAMINKCHRRKKKKVAQEAPKDQEKPLETMENKENDTPKQPTEANNKVAETKVPDIDLEDDEDLLRASLLAGLAKKITRVQSNENIVKAKPAPPKLPVKITAALPQRPITTKLNNVINQNKFVVKVPQIRPKPQVKPLIINIDDDSDSDDETKSPVKMPEPASLKVAELKVISNNVEKFLKEQRAKFETESNKRFQVVNKNKTILEKSAVKLLPKSQQLEYQQLLKQLKLAERKKRAKKIALQRLKVQKAQQQKIVSTHVTVEIPQTEVVSSTVEHLPSSKIEVTVQPVVESKSSCEDVSSKEQTSKESDLDRKKSGLTDELTTLQRTLKEIKMQRNGSLQIKSKYQVLTPIIKKITATSNERKKQEQRIKNLHQELKEARNKLAKSHQSFSALVRELVDKKAKIDRSSGDTKLVKKTQNGNLIKNHVTKDVKCVPVTSTPIKPNFLVEETTVSTITANSSNNDYEDMDVCNSDETDICQIDIVDPNDIDQIFKRKPVVKCTIPEYVSPLNFNVYDRYRHVDPNGIMCPYEVNGSCRDIDCTFKHYLKNHERL